MDDKLRERIDQFNKIKYGNDNETRIIITTLKPNGYTWKQEADDMIEEYNTRGVTTAPNIKE
jgi:hypothetical protein